MRTISDKKFYELKSNSTKEFSIGGMWEEKEWKIEYDFWVYNGNLYKCKHCTEFLKVYSKRLDGSKFYTIYTKCPRVVVAINEGGNNSTGVCLDCILENV